MLGLDVLEVTGMIDHCLRLLSCLHEHKYLVAQQTNSVCSTIRLQRTREMEREREKKNVTSNRVR